MPGFSLAITAKSVYSVWFISNEWSCQRISYLQSMIRTYREQSTVAASKIMQSHICTWVKIELLGLISCLARGPSVEIEGSLQWLHQIALALRQVSATVAKHRRPVVSRQQQDSNVIHKIHIVKYLIFFSRTIGIAYIGITRYLAIFMLRNDKETSITEQLFHHNWVP